MPGIPWIEGSTRLPTDGVQRTAIHPMGESVIGWGYVCDQLDRIPEARARRFPR
jgi:hypothetical protein